MMLLTITAGAQSLDGTWKFNQEATESLNALMKPQMPQEIDMNLTPGLKFNGNDVSFMIWASFGAEGTSMAIEIVVPGTFTRDDNQVSCNYDIDHLDFNITDIKSDDPQMNAMLAEPAAKAMVLGMIKQKMKESIGQGKNGFALMVKAFETFSIKELTETQLTILLGESELILERV